MLPPGNALWICTSGLTPCIYGLVVHMIEDFLYFITVCTQSDLLLWRGCLQPASTSKQPSKRVAISTVLVCSRLGIGMARAANVEASALILQDKSYKALLMAIDTDTQETKTSITTL